jgi:hypothetical protein
MSQQPRGTKWLDHVHTLLVVALVVVIASSIASLAGYTGARLNVGDRGADAEVLPALDVGPFAMTLGAHLDREKLAETTAAQLPPEVRLSDTHEATVVITDPSLLDQVLYRVDGVLGPAVAIGALVLLLLVVRAARRGDPFQPANVRRLRLLALVVGAGGFVASMASDLIRNELLLRSAAQDYVNPRFVLALTPVVMGFLILALAEVFAHGARLREDVAGLV